MALHHASPAEVVDVRPLGLQLHNHVTSTLIKSEHLQVFRLILPKGREFKEHRVPGEITVQCLEGVVDFYADGHKRQLNQGDMLYLNGGDPHSLTGVEDASLLVTVYLRPKQNMPDRG